MSPLLLFAALYGVPEAPQDRSGAISKTFAAKICGTTDTLFVTGIQRAFPHSLGPFRTVFTKKSSRTTFELAAPERHADTDAWNSQPVAAVTGRFERWIRPD